MLVREYQASDQEALRACVIQLQDFEREIFSKTADGRTVAKSYIEYLLEICRANRGRILVAEQTGQVVGYSAFQIWDNSDEVHEEAYEFGYISDLVVLDSHRGKGFGRALLDAAQSSVMAEGVDLVRIGVLAGNKSVRQMYAKYGFVSTRLCWKRNFRARGKTACDYQECRVRLGEDSTASRDRDAQGARRDSELSSADSRL